jgi:hypothetical protein
MDKFSAIAKEVYPDDYGGMINTPRDIKLLRSGFIRGANYADKPVPVGAVGKEVFRFFKDEHYGFGTILIAADSIEEAENMLIEPGYVFERIEPNILYTGDKPCMLENYWIEKSF